MAYMTIATAAARWGLTVRRVQHLCQSGAIAGAARHGRAWMIPEDTAKPADGRTRHAKAQSELRQAFLLPAPRQNPFILHTDLYHTAGTADAVVDAFADYPETQRIFRAQLDYRRGNMEQVLEQLPHFLDRHGGLYSTISAALLLSYCALWRGDAALWRTARQHIYTAPCTGENDRRMLDLWLAIMDSKINDTRQFPDWFIRGDFSCLPADSYSTARLYYARYLFISALEVAQGHLRLGDVEGLGLMRTMPYFLEPMISQARMERTVIPEAYLHLMAAVVYNNLGQTAEATQHIDAALALCLPDRLDGILVEYRTELGSLLDDRLAAVDAEALVHVKRQHKQLLVGWTKLHNAQLTRSRSVTLTAREREVAKLAAYGLANTDIAAQLHIELSSVKQYIFSAMNKVGAEKRSELGRYI